MSKLTDFYNENNVPDSDKIVNEKNILLVIPEPKHNIEPALKGLGLTRFEVATTYPKQNIAIQDERAALQARCVIQIDCDLLPGTRSVKSDDVEALSLLQQEVQSVVGDEYVGLHHHDEFSIKDGLGTVSQMVKLLKAQRRSFCCITNHGSVGGWIRQYNACQKAGIKAIFGMEAYTSDYRGNDPELRKQNRSACHLVLIANNEEGFYNIIRIHNDAQLNGFYYTPRANRAALEKWGKGITASSACMAGELSRLLMADKYDESKELCGFYNRIFDKFFVEIQIIEHEDQKEANRRLIKLAQEMGVPLLLTCDSHYLDSEHAETHDVLMCARQKKTIADKRDKDDVWSFDVRNLYYRNAAQMKDVFYHGWTDEEGETHTPFQDDVFTEEVFNEAMGNTLKVARATEIIKLDSTIKLPKLYESGKDVLRKKINEGFIRRGFFKHPDKDEYLKRIKHEFGVITGMGWGDYFLIMEKIVSDTKEKFGEWAIGYGRGCFHPSMRVVTGTGIPKFIGQVRKGDIVVSHDGTKQRVQDVFEYDVDEEMIELEMNDGRIIRCTLDHKILVNTNNGKVWKEAQNIQENDDIVEV